MPQISPKSQIYTNTLSTIPVTKGNIKSLNTCVETALIWCKRMNSVQNSLYNKGIYQKSSKKTLMVEELINLFLLLLVSVHELRTNAVLRNCFPNLLSPGIFPIKVSTTFFRWTKYFFLLNLFRGCFICFILFHVQKWHKIVFV